MYSETRWRHLVHYCGVALPTVTMCDTANQMTLRLMARSFKFLRAKNRARMAASTSRHPRGEQIDRQVAALLNSAFASKIPASRRSETQTGNERVLDRAALCRRTHLLFSSSQTHTHIQSHGHFFSREHFCRITRGRTGHAVLGELYVRCVTCESLAHSFGEYRSSRTLAAETPSCRFRYLDHL